MSQSSVRTILDVVATLALVALTANAIRGTNSPANPPPIAAQAGALPTLGRLQLRPDAPLKGSLRARVALVEFLDFECPFCGRWARDVQKSIEHDFVDTGMLRYVVVHYPLENIHPAASQAAIASECAGTRGQFWPMYDRLFASPSPGLGQADLVAHARSIGLDVGAFEKCVTDKSAMGGIAYDKNLGADLKIVSTPTFVLGTIEEDGTIRLKRRINGAQSYQVFRDALSKLVEEAGAR